MKLLLHGYLEIIGHSESKECVGKVCLVHDGVCYFHLFPHSFIHSFIHTIICLLPFPFR